MDYEYMEELEELMFNDKYEEAIELINSLDEDEISTEITILLAHAYSCIDKNKKALKTLLDISDDIDDSNIPYYFELAHCYYSIHKYHLAIKALEKCMETDENFTDGWMLMCFIAIDKDDSELFEYASAKAKELDEEDWEEFFGENAVSNELSHYTEDEYNAVINHIEKYFGHIDHFLDIPEKTFDNIKIACIPPSDKCRMLTFITVGMGSYKMNLPEGYENIFSSRTELVAYLPTEWDLKSTSPENTWISRYMLTLATMIQFDDSWIAPGHTISNGSPFAPNTKFNGVIIDNLILMNDKAVNAVLPNGDTITFYQFIPIYEEEMVYKINNGCDALLKLLTEKLFVSFRGAININRQNVCENLKEKNWAIPKSSIEHILEWSGSDGCYATDKIMVENKPVGFMYREKPQSEYDSGWRFMAGDETQEYMDNSENMGIYSLNTLCNYDIDISDYLESPVGSAFYRNQKGDFVEADPKNI